MRQKILNAAAAAVVAVLAANPAFACKGGKILFEDNFSFVDAAWGPDDKVVIANGSLTITPERDTGYSALYEGATFRQADICVDIAMPQVRNVKDEYASAGILFLAEDYSSYYYFWLAPAGYAGVSRFVDKKWTYPVPYRRVTTNNQVGATNTLRVTFGGGKGTIYINDRKIADFRTQHSSNAEYFGLRADSEERAANAWKFSNVKITDAGQ
jgi:hypothetical protein